MSGKVKLTQVDSNTAGSRVELMAHQQTPHSAAGDAPLGGIHPQLLSIPPVGSLDTFSEFSTKYTPTPATPSAGPNLHRDRWYSKRVRRRLVYKNGECNISHANIKKRKQRYLADIFTTLVDMRWRWNLLIFVLAFTLSWMVFALIWWLICFAHGDFDHRDDDENWIPCVHEVNDFTTALLFSIETQHTIGYGSRHTSPQCVEAILIMMFQSCFGVIIQALMTGLVFAKLSRPKKRAETLMFSKNAVICKRDGELCLLFRVGDMRKSHIVEAHLRGLLIRKRVTQEGEVMPLYQHELDIGDEEGECKLFLVWPVILEHRINESSPLWDISAEDLQREQFELIIILEGIVESTGMTTQARTSYLPGEILWGHRFERLVSFQKDNGQYLIDYSRFHSTIPVDIPQCSAKELSEMRKTGEYLDTDDEDDDDDETSETSTTQEIGVRPSTPLIMKRNGIAQTAFDLDNDSQDLDLETPSDEGARVHPYQYMGNRL